MNRPLRLYVYNNEYDVTRMITITPHRAWGGDGALGCVLGFGALHRVPAPLNEPTQAPGETLFESHARFSNEEATRPTTLFSPQSTASPAPPPASGGEFLIPANMNLNTISPPVSTTMGTIQGGIGEKKAKKGRAHHALSPTAMMDDYFKEGEQKSAELDNAPKTANAALPPPPKGGPPRTNKSPAPPAPDPAVEDS